MAWPRVNDLRAFSFGTQGEMQDRLTALALAGNKAATHRFAEVPWEFADAEGEGFTSADDWRDGHRSFYERTGIDVNDDLVVCCWFRVVERLN